VRKFLMVVAFLVTGLASVFSGSCFAQTATAELLPDELAGLAAPRAIPTTGRPGQAAPAQRGEGDSSNRFAVGVKVSTLGVGGEFAFRLTHRINLRAGANYMGLSHSFTDNGVIYAGHLHFRSAEAHFDWFFLGPLHLSPGVMLYNGNGVSATAAVPGGQTFTLNGTTYQSSSGTPVGGSAALTLNKVAPSLLFGVGNLIPRSGRHFSVPFEIGAIYEGAPNIILNLTGNACAPPAGSCPTGQPVATTPGIQADVTAQQNKLNHDVAPYKFYPIISTGFSVAF
jgi:hypothetical protein